ncbi:MAG: adenylate/guanylate cyclase domain-containing protein [Candidatus Nanopelagicales bacterium]
MTSAQGEDATNPTPAPPEEHRVATALFADVSGFTRLATSLPPDELSRVIDPVLSALTTVVDRYGGLLEKYVGDALLALFGAPVAHDDDADRALRCAAQMHDAVREMTHHVEALGLSLHIGVDSGPVLARPIGDGTGGHYGVLGEAVVVAQRLSSLAPRGETYVGRATAQLAGTSVVLEDLGPMTVKGRTEPLSVHRLVAVGDPLASRGRTHGVLAGRQRESAALDEALRGLAAGRGGVVVLAGEAGSGKTRLVEQLAADAAAAGIPVFTGAAASYAMTAPYQPVSTWFAAEEAPAGLADPGPDPEGARATVRAAVAAALRDRAHASGLVAVVEDVHWADDATRELLGVLAVYAPADRVLLVVTGRDEAQAVAVLTAAGAPPPTLLTLDPLGPGAVAELASDLLGGPIDARLRDVLAERSRGNPLFAAELVQALLDRGDVIGEEGRWRLRPGMQSEDLPLTVQAVIAAQVDGLPQDLRDALVTVSVIADTMSVRRAALVLETPPDLARAVLERVVDAGLMVPLDDGYGFRHGLVREVALERMPRRRRREVHVLAAEAAALLGGAPDTVTATVAHHLYEAGARRLALPHLRAAAASARALFANADAEAVLARAVDSAGREPVDPALPDLLVDLAEVRQLQGDNLGAAAAFAQAEESGAGVAAVAGRAGALRRAGEYAAALEVLDRVSGAADVDTRVLDLERSWVLGLLGRRGPAREAALHGLAAGPGDDLLAGRLELQLVWVLMVDGDLDEARAHAERALALVRADPRATVTAYRLLGDIAQRAGDPAAARGVLTLGLGEARRTGNVEEEAACLVNLGLAASGEGDHRDAAASYDAALEAFTVAGNPVGRCIAHGNRAWERMHLGDLAGAERDCEDSLRLSRATGNTLAEADVTNTQALLARRRGDGSAAVMLARRAAELFRSAGAEAEADAADELADELADQAEGTG